MALFLISCAMLEGVLQVIARSAFQKARCQLWKAKQLRPPSWSTERPSKLLFSDLGFLLTKHPIPHTLADSASCTGQP